MKESQFDWVRLPLNLVEEGYFFTYAYDFDKLDRDGEPSYFYGTRPSLGISKFSRKLDQIDLSENLGRLITCYKFQRKRVGSSIPSNHPVLFFLPENTIVYIRLIGDDKEVYKRIANKHPDLVSFESPKKGRTE